MTIKGINKAEILVKKAVLLEVQLNFKKALKEIKKAKMYSICYTSESEISEVEKRLKSKLDLGKKKKKPKKSKKDSIKKSK